jgi:uncharacterized protein (DUF2235 family)
MKRLVLLCDGSWLDPEPAPRPGNVRRLARLIAPRSAQGVEQVLYYHPGAGTAARLDRRDPQAFGQGLDAEIQSLYRFLLWNHAPGDEIFVFGACRGAYIARSLVGMLRNAWLLERAHEARLPQAYHVYRTHWGPDAENAVDFRTGIAREVRVRFLGVWDTVGERGIPLALFPGFDAERYLFHDTRLSRIVDHACHALAIDERRAALPATPWRTRADRTRTEQAWFAGAHADVCGGAREQGLANVTLQWMVEQATRAGLAMERSALQSMLAEDTAEVVHGWIPPAQRAHGIAWRTIGGANADETLHPGAEQRFLRDPAYRPRNLREFLARDEQIRLPL